MIPPAPAQRELLKDPAAKRRLNQRLFGMIAPHYDLINRVLSFRRDQAWKRRLIALLPEVPAARCLDLACGTGDLGELFLQRFPRAQAVGADLTAEMLSLARRRNHSPALMFSRQDMMRLAFPDGSFDTVLGGYALRNAPDLEAALAEIHRVLKPGGTAAFLDFSKPSGTAAGKLQHRILSLWGGLWGYLFHRSPPAYIYIAESLACFPDRKGLLQLFEAHGFEVLAVRYFFFGFTAVHVLRREG